MSSGEADARRFAVILKDGQLQIADKYSNGRTIESSRRARRDWYHKNREIEAEKQRIRRRNRANKFREYLNNLKETTPCKDCGKFFPHYIMDFDHLKDKKFDVSAHGGSKSFDTLKFEISKCEIVCANCHRIRTHNRRIAVV